MDGSSNDRFINGKLFRPLSLERALQEFPEVIYLIRYHPDSFIKQPSVHKLALYSYKDPETGRVRHLRSEDYDLCVDIANKVGDLKVFASDTKQIQLDKIRAWIRVEFSGRL